MLGVYRGLDGIKTGYTQASGFNLVASAQQDGRRLIGVVMGARSPSNRRLIMTSLLNQAFGNERVIEVRESTPPMPTLARNERPQMVATRTTARSSARTGSRASSRASSQASKRAIVSTAPTRGAARSTKTSRSAKSASSTFAMATPKPAAKAKRSASATRTLASSATSSARKAKPQLVSDVKPKTKPTVRRNKRVLVSAR
ncbi:MAG: hypothetical protein HWD60_08595 [Defluviicoccus sp.]|nr:MAG: hypothetical protein HWD60_08595 [Defluviicoccus sp.]